MSIFSFFTVYLNGSEVNHYCPAVSPSFFGVASAADQSRRGLEVLVKSVPHIKSTCNSSQAFFA